MRCLTVQRHESYLITLAQTVEHIDIMTSFQGEALTWQTPLEHCPPSISLRDDETQVYQDLKEGLFDTIIIHTVQDLISFRKYPQPKVFILHIALYTHTPLWALRSFIKWVSVRLFHRNQPIIATTDWKGQTWRLPEWKTIRTPPLPTLPTEHSEKVQAVIIGNHLDSRQEVDFSIVEFLRSKCPVDLIGQNPNTPYAQTPQGRTAYTQLLAKYQIFVFILQHPWEDAYNLAMLESMQTGMAILAFEHPNHFIQHGVNGYLCKDREDMCIRLQELLNDPEKVKRMGEKSQKILQTQFSVKTFKEQWKRSFKDLQKKSQTCLRSKKTDQKA